MDSANLEFVHKGQTVLGGQFTLLSPATASATDTPSRTAANFAAPTTSLGSFPGGGPSHTIDAAGNAICGQLQTGSMSKVVSYEESVDENSTTGMTTKKEVLTFIRDSVEAWCPQYESELPSQ